MAKRLDSVAARRREVALTARPEAERARRAVAIGTPLDVTEEDLHANRLRVRAAVARANRPVLSCLMGGSPVFVGREVELAVLAELAERARANQPQAALIEGEAGIGKSSLLAKLGASLGNAKVLRASGAEDESHLAYGLVAQIVAAGRGVGGQPSKLLARGLNDDVDPLSAGPSCSACSTPSAVGASLWCCS